MTVETELHNMAAGGTEFTDPPTDDYLSDLEKGEYVVAPRQKGKSSTFCCGLIRTPWQCVPACGSCGGITIALLGTIILVANQLLMNTDGDNQQGVTLDTILGAALIVGGALLTITSCGDFWLIRHYKPEKDLEGQLDDYARENARLQVENKGLEKHVQRLDQLLDGFKRMSERQEEITNNLRGLFEEQVSALRFQRTELQLVVQNYEKKVEQGLKDFSSETDQAKLLSEELVKQNKALRERLGELNVNVDGLAAQEEEWEKDLGKLTSENDEFKKHNFELQRLGKILHNQLDMIQQLTEALNSSHEGIQLQAERLDEFDDKLVEGAADLLKVIEEKSQQLEAANLRLAQLTEAMAKFRLAIIELQGIDLNKVESCEGLFQPLLKILDEVSDPAHDEGDSLEGDE